MKVQIGFHVSIKGGIRNSIDNALKIGCTAFQIFTRNPRGWTEKVLNGRDVQIFKSKLKHCGISSDAVAVHMPYLPNLSAPNSEQYKKSKDSLINEVQRCVQLGIPNLVIHLGSHLGSGSAKGTDQLVNSINTAIDYSKLDGKKSGRVIFLLENSAGQKNSIGNKLEEIRSILDRVSSINVGMCVDTCHAFAAGYDLRTERKVAEFVDKFDSIIGLAKLRLVHLNDSKEEIGSGVDRHEHIGLGKIGGIGMAAILKNRGLEDKPIIMETKEDSIRNNLDNLRVALELAESPSLSNHRRTSGKVLE
ncbi:MAG: deoxyribonuclease IV [Thermoproteota archaeon]|nr:deoxyribonuclease IV [Thermoproteota archaeon]